MTFIYKMVKYLKVLASKWLEHIVNTY